MKKMNKAVKGTIAVGVAGALLMGGAGSLAYWQVQQDGGAINFQTGWLTMQAGRAKTWTVNGETLPSNEDFSNIRVVPGDTLVYTEEERIEMGGTNLFVSVTPEMGTLTATDGPDGLDTTAGVNAALNVSYTLTAKPGSGVGVQETTTPGVYNITGSGIGDLIVTVTIDWPEGSNVQEGGAMFSHVDISNTTITLQQVPAPMSTPSTPPV